MLDLTALYDEIRTRIRSQVPELVHDEIVEEMDDAIVMDRCNTPAIFLLITEPSANEATPGLPTQFIDLDVQVGIVTQSARSKADGVMKSMVLRQKIKKALQFWAPPSTQRKMKYRGNGYAGRSGKRSGILQRYVMEKVQETYT